ncbi:Tryptophan synthase alpha chain [gamma proteobacterium HdN1]|nr:Tryptophan synthase alpha chain [gamma proteobacterium HdN1]
MSRIPQVMASLRATGRKALIPFFTAGDPAPAYTPEIMHALVQGGADIIELGVPFSDPMADGPVIQLANERALEHHVGLHQVLDIVRTFRQTNQTTPVVLMGYLNPVEAYGYDAFATDAASAGVDGVLTVDLPPEAAEPLKSALAREQIDSIFLIAPTTLPQRVAKIAAEASGYLYYVSLKGVTGAANLDIDSVREKLETIRNTTDLPVAVGFGIKDANTATHVGALADGVVVGSALINIVAAHQERPEKIAPAISAFLKDLRQALDKL